MLAAATMTAAAAAAATRKINWFMGKVLELRAYTILISGGLLFFDFKHQKITLVFAWLRVHTLSLAVCSSLDESRSQISKWRARRRGAKAKKTRERWELQTCSNWIGKSAAHIEQHSNVYSHSTTAFSQCFKQHCSLFVCVCECCSLLFAFMYFDVRF